MAKTKVYRNLNRRDGVFFSVAHRGRVFGHYPAIFATGVTMKHASEAQAHRCRFGGKRGTGCREVCAWLLCDRVDTPGFSTPHELKPGLEWRRMACDPKKVDGFCDAETGAIIDSTEHVFLSSEGAYYAVASA